ncbi:MAG TPA: NADH-quinone oxidoreductase subunit M [Verrucomicrobiae bacterium]|nr:NADH-quinone oxidoreductase subunit M [Verrucomicrobiae bacterium]
MQVDWTIYLTFLGVGLILLLPRESKSLIRWVALLTGVAALVVALKNYFNYNDWVNAQISAHGALQDGFRQLVNVSWIPTLNVKYHLAVDGISFPLIVLNGFVCVTGILFSWNVENRVKEFFAFFLTLIGGVYGVFMAMDLFLLFVFYELAIIPKYFIIAIWGSTRKEYGAMKLVLYSFVGSALVFIGVLATYFAAGAQTFDILDLAKHPIAPAVQVWVFPLIFVGFAVLAGMWPFHTWAPTGHVAAPTAASMLLAGVVMKLGSYGCFRGAMLLFPQGLEHWRWWIAWMGVIGIVYGAGVALVQKDFKFIIGYSSVSHMGFVLLGLATLNLFGMSGAVLQMFSHGIVASLLFAVVGRMVYDRTHTRQLDELGGLAKVIPFACVTFMIAGAASMGMPGFSGFVAEYQIFVGAFEMHPLLAFAAALSIPLTVAYILNANDKVFMERDQPAGGGHGHGHADGGGSHAPLPPITLPEKTAAVILMALLVIIGVYPSIMLNMIKANVQLFLKGAP